MIIVYLAIQRPTETANIGTGPDPETPIPVQPPNVEEVLEEHRQRVHTLRQRKEEDGRVHHEKIQERLARRRDQHMNDTVCVQ